MSAISVDEEGVMLRPTRYDECVKRRTAELALALWQSAIGTDVELIEMLMRHINRSDGYEIVKSMESDGWCANSLLVEIMDQDFIGDAERELVHQWVRCLNLKLNIPIGTKVKINRGLSENGRIGEVVKHYPKEARYGVRTPEQADTTHWLLCPDYIEVIA